MTTRNDLKRKAEMVVSRLNDLARRRRIDGVAGAHIYYKGLCQGYELGLRDAKEVLTKSNHDIVRQHYL